jgi:hypothetical protein
MSKGKIGMMLLLGASLLLGVGLGAMNFNLMRKTMPPMAISSFNQGTAHVMYLVYGAGTGVVIFIFTMLAMMIAPMFRTSAKK